MIGSSKSLSGFDPRTIPGCQLWLDAADSNSLTLSGSNVTQWSDKSGNGNTVTQSTSSNQPTYVTNVVNGNPVVRFNGTSHVLQTTSFTSLGTNSVSFWLVERNLSGSGGNAPFSFNSGPNNGIVFQNNNGLQPLPNSVPYTSSVARIDFYNRTNTGSGDSTYLNGTVVSIRDDNTTGTYGTTFAVGMRILSTIYTSGDICEILIFIGMPTTSQRQQVEGYLAHKWGLVPYYDSSIPLTIPGCQLWLDVTDSSTTVSSGSVTSITNKSTNTAATLSSTLPTYNSSLINGLPGINFTGSSFIRGNFSSAYTGSNLIVFAVGSLSSTITTAYARLVSFSVPGSLDYNSVERVGAILRQLQIQGISSYRNGGEIGSGTGIAYNTNYLFCTEFTGTTYNFYLNGSKTSTASSSGSFNISAWGVGYLADYGGSDDAAYWKGSFGECITYLGSLTTTQRETIERYLMKKWGIGTNPTIPSTHPFSSIRPHLRAFQPTDIDGCQLWLDGADASTVTLSGSNVSYWLDKSGNGKDATAGGTTLTYSSSTRSIVFGGAGYFTNSTLSLPLSTRSVFIVCRQTSRAADFEGIMLLSSPSDGSIDYDSSTTIPYFASGSNSTVGDTAFSIYNRGNYIHNYRPYILTPLGIYTDVFGSSSGTLYVNGTSNSTDADSSGLGTANGYILGARKFSGTTLSTFLNGSINEILVYNIAVTNSQRQQVEGYLAHKWGLTLYLPVISPLSIPGCAMWFDAADSNTITLSSGSLTQWNDKSGNGRNLTAVSGYANATVSSAFQNGLNVFNFSGNGLYRAAANSAVYPLDVYIIVALKSLTAQSDVLSIGPTNADNFNSLIFSEGTQSRWKNGSSYGVRNVFSTTDETSTGFLLIQWSIANNNYLLRRNGTLLAQSSSFTYSLPGGSIFQVGFRHTDITAANFSGYIGEIVVFNNQLGDSQRQQVEGYLARKWGITISATLPSLHPFKSIPPASLPFSPRNITGCLLWLDAADQSSMTLSGSSVTQWRDKSGNGLNVSAASSQPTYVANGLNKLGTLAFNGSQNLTAGSVTAGQLLGSTGTSATFCVFSVSDNTAGSCPISWDDGSYTYRYIITWDSSGIIFDLGNASAGVSNRRITIPNSTLTFVNNTYYLVSFWQSGGAALLNVNGGAYTATIASGFTGNMPTSTSRTFNVGSYVNTSAYNMKGNIAEILVYNTHIPNNFKQVEGYLAHKWGLASSLFTPLSITGCQLWLDAADSSTITFGTGSSVASWRDKANNYAVANSSASYRPVYSQGTIRFDGVTSISYLDIPTLTIGSSTFSIFFVIRNTSTTTEPGNAWAPHFFWPLSGSGSGALSINGWIDTNIQGINNNIRYTLLKNQYYVISYTFGVTTNVEQLYINGTSVGTYSKGSGYASSLYRIGAINSTNTQASFDGNIGEILVYNTALTTSERQRIEGYLSQKWGLGVSSTNPSTHPFYKFPPA